MIGYYYELEMSDVEVILELAVLNYITEKKQSDRNILTSEVRINTYENVLKHMNKFKHIIHSTNRYQILIDFD